ncbi:MAG: amidase [Gammaproteobacteria bacterium]|nr:amidase [Gammaproteobacteria bacterium]
MSDLDLCYMPGFLLQQQFKTRKLSPVELLEVQIRRAESVNSRINAYTDTYYDEAIEQARFAEKAFARKKGSVRPLEGLTLAIKDNQALAGKRTTQGSLVYQDEVETENSPTSQRLLDAGAIVVAKTTTPEFCSAGVTYSKLFGVTATPWNPAYTSGGSSGGSAASLGAGMVTLATGSDIAGSIRVPAACCGVVGYKPPYGRIPGNPPFNLDYYCQTGPLARSVGDCAMMTNVMSGVHSSDIASLRESINLPLEYVDIKGLRVAYSIDLGAFNVAPEVKQNLMKTVRLLGDLGAEIEEVDLGWGEEVTNAAITYLDHLFGRSLARSYEQHGDTLCDYNIFYAKRAGKSDTEAFLSTYEVANEMYRGIGPVLENFHGFICPTVATHEVSAEAKPWETIRVNGKDMVTDFDWVMAHPFNMLSRLPVIAIPNGIAGNGLPTSIQIVSRSYDDHRAFQLARAIEMASPWLDCDHRRPLASCN